MFDLRLNWIQQLDDAIKTSSSPHSSCPISEFCFCLCWLHFQAFPTHGGKGNCSKFQVFMIFVSHDSRKKKATLSSTASMHIKTSSFLCSGCPSLDQSLPRGLSASVGYALPCAHLYQQRGKISQLITPLESYGGGNDICTGVRLDNQVRNVSI